MFPYEIEKAALVAIHNSEWNSLDLLLKQLHEWMDFENPDVGVTAAIIGFGLKLDIINKRVQKKYIPEVNRLFKYAKVCLKTVKSL